MKKPLLALIASLPLTAYAQFGIRAGIHSTKWSSSTNGRYSSNYATGTQHLSYQVGLTYQLPLVGHLSLVPELNYSYENFELSADNYGYGGYYLRSQLKLSYLTLPVLERITFGPVYAEVGPQLGLLVGGREKGREFTYANGQGGIDAAVDRPAAEQYHRLDVGLCAGLGLQLPMGLGLGLRYVQGVRSLNQDYVYGQGFDGEIRSHSVQASLTYRLKKAS